jgi:hypothetical protein
MVTVIGVEPMVPSLWDSIQGLDNFEYRTLRKTKFRRWPNKEVSA